MQSYINYIEVVKENKFIQGVPYKTTFWKNTSNLGCSHVGVQRYKGCKRKHVNYP